MGDKAILTEVLEASHLTETYSNLTAKNIIKQLKSANEDGSVKYEGFDKENGEVEIKTGDGGDKKTPDGNSFTVDDAIEFLGFGKFQVKISLLTGLAWMADAMEMMILSILSPALHCEWGISSVEQAMITTVVFSGMFLSSTVWGKICDRFGRKVGLMCSALLTFSMGTLSAFAPNFKMFLLLRGLTGIGIGGVPQSITLYAEFLGTAQRAKCVVLIESFWAVGACFESLLAYFIMESLGWRWLLILSSTPLLIFAISCIWLPESPRFLISAGRKDDAYHILQRVATDNNKKMPEGNLIMIQSHNPETRGHISNLFTPNLRNTTFLLWFIWMVNAFSYYGIVLLTTVFLQSSEECHGGGHKMNITDISGCKPLVKDDYVDLLTTTFAEFPGLIITAAIIEWCGRKKTMAVEFGIYSIFTFLLYFCLNRRSVTAFIFVARAFISGSFQCAYVYTPEVYPTSLRAIGLGASSSMARLGAIVTPFVAQVASTHSLYIPITIYGLFALLGTIASLSLPIETRGRKMTDTH
uniref:MFS domain-containing protein n=1 Tax=Strongyloides stercoralis TaxID=6248 RepID=A0A0K0DVX3_STRER